MKTVEVELYKFVPKRGEEYNKKKCKGQEVVLFN